MKNYLPNIFTINENQCLCITKKTWLSAAYFVFPIIIIIVTISLFYYLAVVRGAAAVHCTHAMVCTVCARSLGRYYLRFYYKMGQDSLDRQFVRWLLRKTFAYVKWNRWFWSLEGIWSHLGQSFNLNRLKMGNPLI